MIQHFIEVTGGPNWGKFLLLRYDRDDWAYKSVVDPSPRGLLRTLGWDPANLWVLDIQTGEGAFFKPGGLASADLNRKHRIWCCPMYEPFLTWLYKQDLTDITKLPAHIHLPDELVAEHCDLQGYRRAGDLCGEEGRIKDEPAESD